MMLSTNDAKRRIICGAVENVALGLDSPTFGQHCQNRDCVAAPCTNCD